METTKTFNEDAFLVKLEAAAVQSLRDNPIPPPVENTWSEFQSNIFTFGKEESNNLIIQAVAGSGKSTTLFELAKRIGGSIVFLAFNKIIAEYAKGKLRGYSNIDCRTFHSLGLQLVSKAAGFFADMDQKALRTSKLTAYFNGLPEMDSRLYRGEFYPKFIARRIVKQIRQLGMMSYDVDQIEEFIRMIPGMFSIDPYKRAQEQTWVFQNLHHFPLWLKDLDTLPVRPKKDGEGNKINTIHTVIDFDDMVRLPCIHNLVKRYGISQKTALVDESQDMNPYQIHLVTQLFNLGVRTVCCGDRLQGIYAFRGAFIDSMDRMKEITRASELPLSVTYRSRSAIVDFVNKEIQESTMIAHKDGGEVISVDKVNVVKTVVEQDVRMIVGARNKSLIECWIMLAKQKIASTLKGSRLVEEIRDLIKDIKPVSLDHLCQKLLEDVEGSMVETDEGETTQPKYTIPQQTVELMLAIPDLVESFEMQSLRDLEDLLKEMEQETNREIHTVHSAKGLESRAVIVLCDWFQNPQIENMMYVAYTRAEDLLILVNDWQKAEELV